MNAPPFLVDLTSRSVSTSRELGTLSDALVGGRCDRVLISFGANASRGDLTSVVARWLDRNDRLVRTRVAAFALVVPSLWIRLQWKLFFLLSRPVVPLQVHSSDENARRWLDRLVR
jgi:hypothetical protein